MWSWGPDWQTTISCMLVHGRHFHIVNTLGPTQNWRRFSDGSFNCIFMKNHFELRFKFYWKLSLRVQFNNIRALVQIMAWRGWGEKSLSEPVMVSLPTLNFVTRHQWALSSIILLHLLWCRTRCIISNIHYIVRLKSTVYAALRLLHTDLWCWIQYTIHMMEI